MIEFPLPKGYVTLIDDEDLERVKDIRWYVCVYKNGYVRVLGFIGGKSITMARFLLNLNDDTLVVDHKDRNPLNNQKINLRPATQQQNIWNQSKRSGKCGSTYLGVMLCKATKKWKAGLIVNRKRKHLGTFDCEHSAAFAYNQAVLLYRGEFGLLNVIPDGIEIQPRVVKAKPKFIKFVSGRKRSIFYKKHKTPLFAGIFNNGSIANYS